MKNLKLRIRFHNCSKHYTNHHERCFLDSNATPLISHTLHNGSANRLQHTAVTIPSKGLG
ncbi:hypothetical protein HYPSUDRAFT_893509 [Hypholoma sublateritium FD-334 SS-4]|uniref:Uncharacterized protein n=1 Tax=Hypholoma sublateritium (strain FD-334 SS-4) TaxID=945553 RepID=A0A0D2NKE2_HYPSF|nr:hypothetical protein HYPSUDRAFT_893509 [Hypholoma sublateritium FD-334 SS-4]